MRPRRSACCASWGARCVPGRRPSGTAAGLPRLQAPSLGGWRARPGPTRRPTLHVQGCCELALCALDLLLARGALPASKPLLDAALGVCAAQCQARRGRAAALA
jgi:hypothetical protein